MPKLGYSPSMVALAMQAMQAKGDAKAPFYDSLNRGISGFGAGLARGIERSQDYAFDAQQRQSQQDFVTAQREDQQAEARALLRDEMARKELEDIEQQKREQSRADTLASALGLKPMPGLDPRDVPDVLSKARQDQGAKAYQGLMAPGIGASGVPALPKGVPFAGGMPLGNPLKQALPTPGLVAQRASQSQSPIDPGVIELAMRSAGVMQPKVPAPPRPPAPPRFTETPEGIRFQTDEDIRKTLATRSESKPEETPEQRAERIRREAQARAEGTAAGTPKKAPQADALLRVENAEAMRRLTPQERMEWEAIKDSVMPKDRERREILLQKMEAPSAASASDGPTPAELAEMDAAGMRWDPQTKTVVPK